MWASPHCVPTISQDRLADDPIAQCIRVTLARTGVKQRKLSTQEASKS